MLYRERLGGAVIPRLYYSQSTQLVAVLCFETNFSRMSALSTMMTTLGTVLMAHAAYSTLHFRSILQDLGDGVVQQEAIPPIDVYIELVVSFILLLLGQLMGMGKLQSAEVFSQNRMPLVAPAYRTRNFDIYAHT